ncbi:methyltransferase [Oceanobacillus senegalensis]|uniref:methyltransferase n=1 Tax=Oceanobacillus senegalensis TaxID=1936063 RepID=UPI000A30907F|nr:methyltransferase [Oceanobacillus senegalensis]
MKEYYYDKLLNIKTRKNKNTPNDPFIHYHPYEPTPYYVLEELGKKYPISEQDHIVDFGCGLGRLNFYIHYFYQASVSGIERNVTFYENAIENRNRYLSRFNKKQDKLQFHYCLAEEYVIRREDNCFYFFNPFSVEIFRRVVQNILASVELIQRSVDLILYYPHDDYIYFLEMETLFELVEEVRIPGLYERNPYERILIYRLNYMVEA